jgi:hypothetical protein
MQDDNLFRMLSNDKNKVVLDTQLEQYAKIMNNLIISISISLVIGGLLTLILNIFFNINLYFSYNDYASFIIGNTFYIFAFILIKNSLYFHAIHNPVTIFGFVFPAFFNARVITLLINRFIANANEIYGLFLVISIVFYYMILNDYYLRKNKHE